MGGVAVTTGLIFVRFSRPYARLEYSRNLVVTPFNGRPALMFRVANLRHQAMTEAEFRLVLVRNERTREGEEMRLFYPLRLQFDRLPLFPPPSSPSGTSSTRRARSHGLSPSDWERDDCRFLASVACIDTVIPAPLNSQQIYSWEDVRFGHRFVEIYRELDHARLEVDYGRLHEIERAGEVS